MFWQSQLFGVIVGALIAAVATIVLEATRTDRARSTRARELRQTTNADAIRALYELRESLIHLFILTDRSPQTVASVPSDLWDNAFREYDGAGKRVGEMIHICTAFGAVGVTAALREFAHVTQWYHGKYLRSDPATRLPFSDLEAIMEYLLATACEEARRDSEAGHGAKVPPEITYQEGSPSWLASLAPAVAADRTAQGPDSEAKTAGV